MMRTQCRYTPTVRSAPSGRPSCENGGSGSAANGLPLAMVYGREQRFEDLYTPAEALGRGTFFKQLDMPFHKGFRI